MASVNLDEFKAPFISVEKINEIAEQFRGEYWRGKELPVNVEEIAEFDFNLDFILLDDIFNKYEIDAFISADLKTLTIDKGIYNNPGLSGRLRFSIAHELGHIILHEKIYRRYFNFESVAEWIESIEKIPEEQYSWFEYQAYEFAGRLLVPKDELIKQIDKYKNEIGKYLKKFPDRPEAEDSKRDFLLTYISKKVNQAFGVSSVVIEKRIKKEKIDLYNL